MAELSCGGSCMKYILFIFNIVFFLCGATVLAVGIWIKVDNDFDNYFTIVHFNDSNPYYDDAVWTLIAIGAIVFLVGFLGCCGACMENTTMLAMYVLFLVIVIILQIAAGVLVIVYKEELGNELEDEMTRQAREQVTNDTADPLSAAWFTMQYEFSCCGGNNFTDYYNSTYHYETAEVVPLTCCVLQNDDPLDPVPLDEQQCLGEAKNQTGPFYYLHTQGCYESLNDWLEENIYILIGIAFAVAFIEIFGIMLACCLRSNVINPGTYK